MIKVVDACSTVLLL